MKQTNSMLPRVCSVIDHRRRQNVVRTPKTHSPNGSCATFFFLPNLEVHSPHSAFSTPRVFHILHFPHPKLRTPRFPPNQILTSSVIYYRTDARQHGIKLSIWSKLTAKTEHSLYYGKYLFLNTTKSNAKPMLQPDLDYKYNYA